MTRCHSETHHPDQGFAWTEPDPLDLKVETPRLIVRPYELGDIQATFETINACRDSLLPWLPWARSEHRDLASTMEFVAKQVGRLSKPLTADGVALAIFERDSGELAGGTGFHDLRRDTASVEVGYWVRGDRTGRGYCTEAVAHWISRILAPQSRGGLGLNRVRVFCSAENKASARVPEKLGLRPEVMQRQDYLVPHHGVTDRLGWGVLAGEWDTKTHKPRGEPGSTDRA